MNKTKLIKVKDSEISIIQVKNNDYISLTDIAKYRDSERSDYIIQNWLRNRSTIEFIGLWEIINNPVFNSIEFEGIKNQAGSNSFSLTPKRWIETTNSLGIISKAGRYGSGTFAHKDIAFEFASWISAEFKLYLITEFQRLKDEESNRLKLEWNLTRTLSKINYQIHTDAIKENLIPQDLSKSKQKFIYANEADILNLALFGMTAKNWVDKNPDKKGNLRDFATIEQLVVLSNMESFNSELIKESVIESERLIKLNKLAIEQMKVLINSKTIKKLK